MTRRLFIAGFMKCGTTALFNLLAQHPGIMAAHPKEPAFFSNEEAWAGNAADPEAPVRALAAYAAHFGDAPHEAADEPWLLDGSTAYGMTHKFPGAAERIRGLADDCRFLFVVRDPIARIQSHYRHDQSNYWGELFREGRDGVHPHAVAVSDYARHLDVFVSTFGRQRVHVLRLEDLRADPAACLQEICAFLGLAAHPFDVAVATNASQDRRQVRPWVRRVGRWVGLGRHQGLAVWLRDHGLGRLFLRGSAPDFVLPDAWAQEARVALAEPMARLAATYGIDVTPWGFDQESTGTKSDP